MGISHKYNTGDLLINRGGHAITWRAPYPKGIGCGNVLAVGYYGILPQNPARVG